MIILQFALGLGPVTLLILVGLESSGVDVVSWVGVNGEFVIAYQTAGLALASMTLAFISIIKNSPVNSEASVETKVLGASLGVLTFFWIVILWPYDQEVVLACEAPGALQRCLESQAIGVMIFFLLLSFSVPAGIIAEFALSRGRKGQPYCN